MESKEAKFNRAAAETAVEEVMQSLNVGGDVTISVEDCVVAFMTEDDADYPAVRKALEASGFKIWSIASCKWEVEQYDEDVEKDVIYDERVIAVAFDYPGLNRDNFKIDYSSSEDDEDEEKPGAAP